MSTTISIITGDVGEAAKVTYLSDEDVGALGFLLRLLDGNQLRDILYDYQFTVEAYLSVEAIDPHSLAVEVDRLEAPVKKMLNHLRERLGISE